MAGIGQKMDGAETDILILGCVRGDTGRIEIILGQQPACAIVAETDILILGCVRFCLKPEVRFADSTFNETMNRRNTHGLACIGVP